MLGILESVGFWASHIAFMNDPNERDAWLADYLKTTPKRFSHHPQAGFVAYLLSYESWSSFKTHPVVGKSIMPAYVLSFSTKRDDLSQWRAYGPSQGCALKMSRQRLQQLATDQAESPEALNAHFRRCIYQEDEKLQLADETFVAALAKV